jgi:hypothetical protein
MDTEIIEEIKIHCISDLGGSLNTDKYGIMYLIHPVPWGDEGRKFAVIADHRAYLDHLIAWDKGQDKLPYTGYIIKPTIDMKVTEKIKALSDEFRNYFFAIDYSSKNDTINLAWADCLAHIEQRNFVKL